MKKESEDPKTCSNPGCGQPAENDNSLCDSCDLEWSLFHREVRAEEGAHPSVPTPPAPSDNALPVS